VTMNEALHILCEVHTASDDLTGYVVHMGARPGIEHRASREQYLEAWKVVRDSIHLQTEPTTR